MELTTDMTTHRRPPPSPATRVLVHVGRSLYEPRGYLNAKSQLCAKESNNGEGTPSIKLEKAYTLEELIDSAHPFVLRFPG
jgi:hypothetical protein